MFPFENRMLRPVSSWHSAITRERNMKRLQAKMHKPFCSECWFLGKNGGVCAKCLSPLVSSWAGHHGNTSYLQVIVIGCPYSLSSSFCFSGRMQWGNGGFSAIYFLTCKTLLSFCVGQLSQQSARNTWLDLSWCCLLTATVQMDLTVCICWDSGHTAAAHPIGVSPGNRCICVCVKDNLFCSLHFRMGSDKRFTNR